MKSATHGYKPLMSSGKVGRTIRWADEVWTPSGIVDSIRFEDYVSNCHKECRRINYTSYLHSGDVLLKYLPEDSPPLGQCKIKGLTFPNEKCKGCFYHVKEVKNVGMCVTCFECKISLSDFKSINGHNFHGNRNYYVVPKDLVKKVEDMVREDIGILMWIETDKYTGLRLYKECKFKEISDTLRWQLLYNAMKKWCDGAVFLS